jgi:hypothetical protein
VNSKVGRGFWKLFYDLPPEIQRLAYVTLYTVINRKGKTLTQAAMISKNLGVNAAMGSQCVNVRQDRFAKIASEAGRLVFIESKPGD